MQTWKAEMKQFNYRRTFKNTGEDFSGRRAAEAWLERHGYVLGVAAMMGR